MSRSHTTALLSGGTHSVSICTEVLEFPCYSSVIPWDEMWVFPVTLSSVASGLAGSSSGELIWGYSSGSCSLSSLEGSVMGSAVSTAARVWHCPSSARRCRPQGCVFLFCKGSRWTRGQGMPA